MRRLKYIKLCTTYRQHDEIFKTKMMKYDILE